MNVTCLKSPFIALLVLGLVTSPQIALADDWGCEVLLCLATPQGPTHYAECRAPIERLWSHLAKGKRFPTCSGIGFQASKPVYEPYFCDEGYRLEKGGHDFHADYVCRWSASRYPPGLACAKERNWQSRPGWGDRAVSTGCAEQLSKPPHRRGKANYIDLILEGVGQQRIWF